MGGAAVVAAGPGRLVGLGLKIASPIALPGGDMGCCAEGVGTAADGVVSFRLGESAVGVCGPVFGDSGLLAPKNMRSQSRFLPDIF